MYESLLYRSISDTFYLMAEIPKKVKRNVALLFFAVIMLLPIQFFAKDLGYPSKIYLAAKFE